MFYGIFIKKTLNFSLQTDTTVLVDLASWNKKYLKIHAQLKSTVRPLFSRSNKACMFGHSKDFWVDVPICLYS